MEDGSDAPLPTESAGERRRWSELPTGAKAAIVVAGVAELVMTSIAVRDLLRRPARDVRGPKAVWFLTCFVQPIGAPLYLALGRRIAASPPLRSMSGSPPSRRV